MRRSDTATTSRSSQWAWTLLLLVALTWARAGVAQPVLDGLIDQLYITNGNNTVYQSFIQGADGRLYIMKDSAIDPDFIWFVWVISKAYNDLSYGDNRHSSWPAGHSFDDLIESDNQRLDIKNTCNELVIDVTMDLLDGPGFPTPSGYDKNKASAETTVHFLGGVDADWDYDQSLGANLNDNGFCSGGNNCTFNGVDLYETSPPWSDEPNYVPTAPFANWVMDPMWEIKVRRSLFNTGTCPSGDQDPGILTTPVELHASPNKLGIHGNDDPPGLQPVYSSIGDYVWLDVDHDGNQDVGEPGIANVTVTLYQDPNDDGDFSDRILKKTTVTDSNGGYLFDKLPPGAYEVDVTDTNGVLTGLSLTTGSTDPHTPINLGIGEDYLIADFGYVPNAGTAIMGDYVWSDADNDGVQDAGEPGIGGVVVHLFQDNNGNDIFDAGDTDHGNQTTSGSGFYLFTGLAAGSDYRIEVLASNFSSGGPLDGYTLTTGPQSSPDPSGPQTLSAGAVFLNHDFGYFQAGLGSIGDFVWQDIDGDGVVDAGEAGITNVTVGLIEDSNGNGVRDAGEPFIASAITDTAGAYSFVGLSLDDGGGDGDADYLVVVTDSLGVLSVLRKTTGPTQGSNNNSQTEPYAVALSTASPTNNTADFGYWFPEVSTKGVVGDLVWLDSDGDGVQDAGEPGIAGVEVQLERTSGGGAGIIGTYSTDGAGSYYFNGLDLNRTYRVTVLPSNFASGGPLEGMAITNQVGGQPANARSSFSLSAANRFDFSLDFGYNFTGAVFDIGDYAWFDTDADGVQDASESGVSNVTLALYRDTDGDGVIDVGTDPLLATTVTDGLGGYVFSGFPDGDYIVLVTDQNGSLIDMLQSFSATFPATINGADVLTADFGYYIITRTAAVISDFSLHEDAFGRAVIRWQTASEVGTVGFHLLRLNTEGRWTRVNKTLLPALLVSPQGGQYQYVDDSADAKAQHTYRLVEIEAQGGRVQYGDYTVTSSGSVAPPGNRFDARAHPLQKPKHVPSGVGGSGNKNLFWPRPGGPSGSDRVVAAKIGVQVDGLHQVSSAELAAALGLKRKLLKYLIRRGRLNLTNAGDQVAWKATPDGDGMLFYGVAPDDLYRTDNIYRVAIGKGRVMSTIGGGAPNPRDDERFFFDTSVFEEDAFAVTVVAQDPDADYWHWSGVLAGDASVGTEQFAFDLATPVPAEGGRLTVRLKGATVSGVENEHHVHVTLNGAALGDAYFDDFEAPAFDFDVPAGVYLESDNVLTISGLLDTGVEQSIFFIDSFDAEYARRYTAVSDQLMLLADGSVVTVDGFTTPDISVINTSDPLSSKWITDLNVEPDEAGYRISFVSDAGAQYLVVAGSAVYETDAASDFASNLRRGYNTTEHLIISPELFADAATALRDYREATGLSSRVVLLEDIYDEFNFSNENPYAIRDFLQYAHRHWSRPPRFVVLVGDGTLDYRGLLGIGDNYMPILTTGTPDGLFASDNRFVDFNDDGSIEMAIGRIPVDTPEQLLAYVDKLDAYENLALATPSALVLSDDRDTGGDFPSDAEALLPLIAKMGEPDHVSIADSGAEDARSLTLALFDAGLTWMHYIGHGGMDRLASEGLITNADVPGLSNQTYPVMIALTCIINRFEISGFDALGEQLVTREDAGAVAVWAPTGLSTNWEAMHLGIALYESLDAGTTVGDGVRQALELTSDLAPVYLQQSYTLLGDPATRVH